MGNGVGLVLGKGAFATDHIVAGRGAEKGQSEAALLFLGRLLSSAEAGVRERRKRPERADCESN